MEREGDKPRIDEEDSICFGEVQSDAAGLQGDEETLNSRVSHEGIDGSLALSRCHGPIKHDGGDPRPTQAPLHKLQHRREAREDNTLAARVLGSQKVQVIQQSLDLRAAREFLHVNSVDDGRFLDRRFVLHQFRLLEVDGQRQMAAWAVGRRVRLLARLDVILDARAAEIVLTRRPNGVFRRLVTDTAT